MIIQQFLQNHKLSLDSRRNHLIEMMENLEFSCAGCTGICCTFEYNSMKVSLSECLLILSYLETQSLLEDENFWEHFNSFIQRYRLHQYEVGGVSLRKYYTCPFYLKPNEVKGLKPIWGDQGCALPREFRPIGCLKFNPTKKEGYLDLSCALVKNDQSSLEDEILLEDLAVKLGIGWKTCNLPQALKEVWSAIKVLTHSESEI